MQPQETSESSKMGVMPVRRLLIQMSWPIVISMLAQALYNMVDSVFLSHYDERAFLALGLTFPVQTFMIAICVGTGVGVNAILSRRLGEKNPQEAGAVAMNGIFIYLLCFCAFALFGLTFSNSFVTFFTDDPLVIAYGAEYLRIVCCCSIGCTMQFAFERVLQSTGHPIGHMLVQGTGVLFNLIFDPILIFGLFGFPAMGVAGAAIATVGGQIFGAVVGLLLTRRIKVITLRFRGFRPSLKTIGDIFRIGIPAVVTQTLVTVMVAGLNKILGVLSDQLVWTLTAYFRLQNFIYMPVISIIHGMVPIVGYNYGAREKKRITDTVRFALIISACIMLAGTFLMQLFPEWLLSPFQPSPDALQVGVPALRIISLSFPIAAVTLIFTSTFQALGSPLYSLLISAIRQILFVLPAAWVLGQINPSLVWYALPLADGAAAVTALLFFFRIYRVRIMPLDIPSANPLLP